LLRRALSSTNKTRIDALIPLINQAQTHFCLKKDKNAQ